MDLDLRSSGDESEDVTSEQFKRTFGEDLASALDINAWTTGDNLAGLTERLEREIAESRNVENETKATIRREIFPKIARSAYAPVGDGIAGVFKATPDQVDKVLRNVLFAGNVQAVDGTSVLIDTLPITIAQIGVCSTTYRGNQGEWGHRLYRRDFRAKSGDEIEDMVRLLEARRERTGFNMSNRRDVMNDMLRRGFMTWAERSVLAYKCDAEWRMGHGNLLAYELLTGSGMPDLIGYSLPVLRDIIERKKFVFVPSSSDRAWATIAEALKPLEYGIFTTMVNYLADIIGRGHYRGGRYVELKRDLDQFASEVGPDIVMGYYRVSSLCPPHAFYAHRENAHFAALIAMADGALMEHRGFPLLIDLADTLCGTMFHGEPLHASAHLAFGDAEPTLDYATERMTR
jgi:hypothetical protein